MPDRVSQPRGSHLPGKFPAIREDGSMGAVWGFINDHDHSRRLHNPGQTAEIEERDADRPALRQRTILAEVLDPLLTHGFGPGRNAPRREVLGDVVIVPILTGPTGL